MVLKIDLKVLVEISIDKGETWGKWKRLQSRIASFGESHLRILTYSDLPYCPFRENCPVL